MEFVQPPAKVRHLWKSRLAKLTDEQRRALRVLASHPHGCPEDAMLEQGFTVVQLGQLGYDGLAKLRAAGRPGGFVVKITAPRGGGRSLNEMGLAGPNRPRLSATSCYHGSIFAAGPDWSNLRHGRDAEIESGHPRLTN
jgi:hypothetical protein